jgi:hypothetical protein
MSIVYGPLPAPSSVKGRNVVLPLVLAIIPIVIAVAAVIVAVVALVPAFRGDRRSAELFRWQQDEGMRLVTMSQPSPVPTGGRLGVQGQTIPQWLDDKNDQTVELQNPGGSAPIEVRGLLFRATTFYPEANRPTNLAFAYWDGKLNGPLPPGGQSALTMYIQEYPLKGDESVIPGYTVCPQNTAGPGTPGQHYYFARLTLTFRDATGKTLASVFDCETEVINNSVTQTMKPVVGPIEVKQSLRDLIDQATQNRLPPVFRPLPLNGPQ